MKRAVAVGIAAGAAAILVGAGTLAWWMSTRPPSLAETADTYLQALVDGDAAAVASLLTAESREALAPTLDAFENAVGHITEYETPSIVETDATLGGGSAAVMIDGEPAVVLFGLQLVDGRWRLDHDFLAAPTVTTTMGDAVEIGRVVFPLAETVQLLPGVYEVDASPAGLLSGSTSVALTNERPATIAVAASLAPEAAAAAQAQLDAYLEECARPATTVPTNCGIRIPWAADLAAVTGIVYRIDARPSVVLSPDARTFAATGGSLVATVAGTALDGSPASVTYRADDWALRGTLAFVGDEMVLSVD